MLERGRDRTQKLIAALAAETPRYGLHGGPAAQGLGARIAGVRSALGDRAVDTGMVMRLAALDIEHVTTLLGHLSALAMARADDQLAAFCREWESAVRPEAEAIRAASVALGESPDLAAAPLDSSPVGRAAHGIGWAVGSIGEAIDRVVRR